LLVENEDVQFCVVCAVQRKQQWDLVGLGFSIGAFSIVAGLKGEGSIREVCCHLEVFRVFV